MGRKRKVPPGLNLKNWHDSFDDTSSDDEACSQLPPIGNPPSTLLRQDLSPTPSGAPSTDSSSTGNGRRRWKNLPWKRRRGTLNPQSESDSDEEEGGRELPHDIEEHDGDAVLRPESEDVVALAQSEEEGIAVLSPLSDSDSDVDGDNGRGDDDNSDSEEEGIAVLSPLSDSDVDGVNGRGDDDNQSLLEPFFQSESGSDEEEGFADSDEDAVLPHDGENPQSDFNEEEGGDVLLPEDDADGENGGGHDDSDLESLDSWEGNEGEDEENHYYSLLQALSEKWLVVELNHTVSKTASNAFWRIATSLVPILFETKKRLGISRKTPQFVHLRRKLHKQFLPTIHHTTAYQDKDSLDIVEVPGHDSNLNNSHIKIFETASVSVGNSYLENNSLSLIHI